MRVWTKHTLHQLVQDRLRGFRFIAVSNREPYIHNGGRDGRIECMQPASGLATAIDPIMRASGGVWVAHGSGSADRQLVDEHDHVMVPPEAPGYTLRRVWLPKEVEQGYYYGLANEGLWPLCHIAFQRPRFSEHHWECYRRANELFAEAVLQEAADQPAFVFIQDYHFALLPRLLKDRNPNLVVAQFWHIPWPNREAFRAFPWGEELLHGLLGNDLLGFHLPYHCANFLDTVDRQIEALVNNEHGTVTRRRHVTTIRPFPISIDFAAHTQLAISSQVEAEMARWEIALGSRPAALGIAIDRVDYTKGINERLHAIDQLLTDRPEYRKALVFVQIAVPSRTAIPEYCQLNETMVTTVNRINARWQTASWKPIVLVHRHVDQPSLIALHRMANVCLVTSLHDGMNLVAKEFVASRTDSDGVLVLSNFTGAARELRDALLVNPFAPHEIANAIHQALIMGPEERQARMASLRTIVATNNIYRWAAKVVQALSGLEEVHRAAATPMPQVAVGAA